MSGRPLRILCVSWHFVPRANAVAFVAAKMVSALIDQGCEVKVLWCDAARANENIPRDDSPVWESLRNVSEGLVEASAPTRLGDLRRLARYGAQESWVEAAVRRARELAREAPFDLVYSMSAPKRSHVAGYWCARALGARWAVSLYDPWEYYHSPWWEGARVRGPRRWLSEYWLGKTLRVADIAGFMSARLAAFTARTVGSRRVGDVVPLVGWSRPAEACKDRFDLVYAGHMGIGRRSPRVLLAGLGKFLAARKEARSRTRLTFVGPDTRAEETRRLVSELDAADVVHFAGRVSYEDNLRHISGASACLLVEPDVSEGIYLLAKFVDYMAARKPVVALSPKVGTLSDMTPDPGLLRVDPNDADGVARAIGELYEEWSRGTLDARRPSEKLARTFDAAEVARNFLALVEQARRTPRE